MEKRFKCSIFLLSLVCFSFNVQAVAYRKLWTFPEAKRQPFLEAIQSAQTSIQLAAYQLSDPALIQALKKAAQRSVRIDILYEPDVYKHNRQEVQTSAVFEQDWSKSEKNVLRK